MHYIRDSLHPRWKKTNLYIVESTAPGLWLSSGRPAERSGRAQTDHPAPIGLATRLSQISVYYLQAAGLAWLVSAFLIVL